MSTEAWIDAARKSENHQKAEYQRTIDILESVFEGNRDPDSAACQLNTIYEPLLKENHKDSPVNQLWGIVCDAIRILGANTIIDERLINLLNALTKLPDVTDQSSQPVAGGNGVDGVYWKDLPNLAVIFREYAIGKSDLHSQ